MIKTWPGSSIREKKSNNCKETSTAEKLVQEQMERWCALSSIQGLLEMGDFVWTIFNAMPLPVFVVDDDVQIIAVNKAASQMLVTESKMMLYKRAGEILRCVHSKEAAGGCGRTSSCNNCVIRNSVTASFRESKIVHQKVRMEKSEEGKGIKEIFLLVTTAPFEYYGKGFVLLILQDLCELMELRRILPICAHCKKIRSDDQYWHSVEQYFKKYMDQDFSHGICPECMEEFYPGYCKKKHT